MPVAPLPDDPVAHAIPILLGVTGHRDLRSQDHDGLSRAIRDLIAEVRVAAPGSPVVLLTALAEGADQLAATVALDAGAQLWVPLPLEPSEYRRDFSDDAARRFDELLARAAMVVPLGLAPGNTAASVREPGPERSAQYALASAWILRRCLVLIALWDGSGPESIGGTACTVRWRLEGVPERFELFPRRRSALDVAEGGPVWHVVTPRGSSVVAEGAVGRIVRKYPEYADDDPSAAQRLAHTIRRIGAFNAELMAVARDGSVAFGERDTLVDAAALRALPRATRAAGERYSLANALALAHRDQTRVAVPWVFGAAFLSVLCLVLFAHVFAHDPWWLLGYLLAFLGGFAILRLARQGAHEQKHIDYRALAEAMRVQFFWLLAGSREWAADSYLRIHRSELDWVRDALRAWNSAHEGGAAERADATRWELVRSQWIDHQNAWFADRARARHASNARCKRRSSLLLWSGFAVAVLLLGLLLMDVGREVEPAGREVELAGQDVPGYVHYFIVASALLVLVGGLVRAYAEKMGFEPEANRYRLMTPLFERADRRLEALLGAGRGDEAVLLVEELGREALAENAEWLLSRRERRLEALTSG
jgi:CheY-like chemotaxis protein